MLQVKSAKHLSASLRGTWRSLLLVLLLVVAGCTPQEPASLDGNVPKPSWAAPAQSDMTSSMTAVIKIAELRGQAIDPANVGEEDLLAAFVGDECRGIAHYEDGLFFLYIAGPGEKVSLRYWSAHYRNLFVAPDMDFVNDGRPGSAAEPLAPKFK